MTSEAIRGLANSGAAVSQTTFYFIQIENYAKTHILKKNRCPNLEGFEKVSLEVRAETKSEMTNNQYFSDYTKKRN